MEGIVESRNMLVIIIVMFVMLVASVIISYINARKQDRELDKMTLLSEKHFSMFCIMNNWMEAKQQAKRMDVYLEKRGFRTVAIYGMHYIGERLYKELENTQIEVKYGIDKNKDGSNCALTIYKPDEKLPMVDAIIVTTPLYYYSIKRTLGELLHIPIVSIMEVVEGME